MSSSILTIIFIAAIWTLFIRLPSRIKNIQRKQVYFIMAPVAGWTSIQREVLKNRLKRKDVPIVCTAHSVVLTRGQLALVDPTRCQICAKLKESFPPPPPQDSPKPA